MKKKYYKRLGDFIEAVDERNTDNSISLSQGISNNKYFQTPRQVAVNTANDKIVRHGYFAYNKATTRNGDKISIAYREGADCTVSSAYQIFRITNEDLLNPYFLWMWFKRPEFDRYARFKSHGSAHEFFEFEEMCEVYLPVPPIEEQRKIVSDYETLTRRIKLNEQMIQKLEGTAQTIYRKMFVDDIDPENLPEGWRMGTLGDISEIIMGQSPLGESYNELQNGEIFYQGRTDFGFRHPTVRMYTTTPTKMAKLGDILLSVRAPVGDLNIAPHNCCIGRGLAAIRSNMQCNSFVFYLLQFHKPDFDIQNEDGTIFGSINKDTLINLKIQIPTEKLIVEFDRNINKLDKMINLQERGIIQLIKLQSLCLARMG